MPEYKNFGHGTRRIHVLNIHALRQYLRQMRNYNTNAFNNGLIACDDQIADMVARFRDKIYCICKIDLGYQFGFNKETFEFDNVQAFNKATKAIKSDIEKKILDMTHKMLNYISLRKHVYINNIVDFTNDEEQTKNINQFIEYYKAYIYNRKHNVKSSLLYVEKYKHENIFDPLPTKFVLDGLIKRNGSDDFLYNLFSEVLVMLERPGNEDTPLVSKTPLYNSRNQLLSDYAMAKADNLKTKDFPPRTRLVQYLTQLILRIAMSRGIYGTDEKFSEILNDPTYNKVEKNILRSIIQLYGNKNVNTHLRQNSKFYNSIKDEPAQLLSIFKDLFVYLNYGHKINGLTDSIEGNNFNI